MRQMMPPSARFVWIPALLLLLPAVAAAETFTVTLDTGNTFLSRYQPKLSPDESKVMLLTENGNWIAFPLDRVADLTTTTESRGFGRVIDTTTIDLGLAPNEYGGEEQGEVDPTTRLLQYMSERDSAQRDYSVEQFVDTEGAGAGGFPTSFAAGSTFGNPTGFGQPSFAQPGGGLPQSSPAPADNSDR